MRLSNKSRLGHYQFRITLAIMTFVGGIIAFIVERFIYSYLDWEAHLLLIIPSLILIVFIVRGRPIFEYDSDGEGLNFKNRNIVLSSRKHLNDEFPQYKMLNFEILNFVFFRRLYIKIDSKKTTALTLRYDISYLSSKELKDLRFSLSKVTNENRKNKEREHS
jgi:hypothetical protein